MVPVKLAMCDRKEYMISDNRRPQRPHPRPPTLTAISYYGHMRLNLYSKLLPLQDTNSKHRHKNSVQVTAGFI